MKHLFSFLLLLLSINISGQIRGTVFDKTTGKAIQYANVFVKDQNIGSTSNIDGNFIINQVTKQKILVVSAIGYQTKEFIPQDDNVKIELAQKIYDLPEITVIPKQNKRKLIIDSYRATSIKNYFACSSYPWIVTKYFRFSTDYNSTPFLKQIKLLTNCQNDSSSFNLRLIAPNMTGEPGPDLLKNNLIITARSGKKNTKIDLSSFNIRFPQNGLFIAVEWLIIDRNVIHNKNNNGVSYDPMFGVILSEGNNDIWVYSGGKWKKTKLSPPGTNNQAKDLAIELILTN